MFIFYVYESHDLPFSENYLVIPHLEDWLLSTPFYFWSIKRGNKYSKNGKSFWSSLEFKNLF